MLVGGARRGNGDSGRVPALCVAARRRCPALLS